MLNNSSEHPITDVLLSTSGGEVTLGPIKPWEGATTLEQSVYQTAYMAARALHDTVVLRQLNANSEAALRIQAKALAEAQELAFMNPVTGLPNRNAFERELNERVERQDKIAVAVIDVTNLKSVNDRYGHTVGDEVLRSTAILIETSIILDEKTRHQDFVAHLHGDEFAVIFDMEPRENEALSAEQRIQAISHNFTLRMTEYAELSMPQELGVDAAIGIVLHESGRSPVETFDLADAAMYRHKVEQHKNSGTTPR